MIEHRVFATPTLRIASTNLLCCNQDKITSRIFLGLNLFVISPAYIFAVQQAPVLCHLHSDSFP